MKYKAVLIGLGNISHKFGKDLISGSSLSHFSAYSANPRIDLLAGFSPIRSEAENFEAETGIKSFLNLNELFSIKPDIVSICSPTEMHYDQLEMCIKNAIPMVWMEKPVADSSAKILDLYKASKKPQTILVNFFRRYHSAYQQLKQLIEGKYFGEILAINISYSRGLSNNGIHMLDLIYYLFDDLQCKIIWVENKKNIENPSFILETKFGLKIFVIGTNTHYHNIDIIVTAEDGRMSVIHGGMTTRIEKKVEHELFHDFYRLVETSDDALGVGGFNKSFDIALSDLIASYENSDLPKSNLSSSYKSQKLLEELISFKNK